MTISSEMLPFGSDLVNSLLSVVALQVALWRRVAWSSPDRIAAATWGGVAAENW